MGNAGSFKVLNVQDQIDKLHESMNFVPSDFILVNKGR